MNHAQTPTVPLAKAKRLQKQPHTTQVDASFTRKCKEGLRTRQNTLHFAWRFRAMSLGVPMYVERLLPKF